MITEFAPPEREIIGKIKEQNVFLRDNYLIKTLLNSSPDIIMIINKQRQIVLANDNCISFLNINDEEKIIGKRPGEAIGCINSDKTEGGCGTTKDCKYCGAVHAILESQKTERKIIEDCIITTKQDNIEPVNLRIWTNPFEYNGAKFTILAVRDISIEKNRQFLERIFFYNTMNLAGGVHGIMELIPEMDYDSASKFQSDGLNLTHQLIKDMESKNFLSIAERGELSVELRETDISELLISICNLYKIYGAKYNKFIENPEIKGDTIIKTEPVILTRVIGNLIKNAIETSNKGRTVKVSYKKENGEAIFSVHNDTTMTEKVKSRIFNKLFSTKPSSGRGLKTYGVKLLTEKYLKGKIEFTSEKGEGTFFYIKFKEETEKI